MKDTLMERSKRLNLVASLLVLLALLSTGLCLGSESQNIASNAIREYRDLESSLLERLGETLLSEESDVESGQLIRALGRIRSSYAVDILIENILFIPTTDGPLIDESKHELESYYPAAVALISIGGPAQSQLLRIVETGDPMAKRLATWSLMKILGESAAACLLRDARKRSARPEEYDFSIKYIEEYEPEYRPPDELLEAMGLSSWEELRSRRRGGAEDR